MGMLKAALQNGRRGMLLALAALLATTAAVLSYEVTEPWIGHHDFTGAFYSIAALNHLRYGLVETRLGMVLNADRVIPAHFQYYSHHPPLLSLLVALSFAVFGIHEWAARLVPIGFSLGSLCLVYVLGASLRGQGLGLLAAFFFAFSPMNGYFGRMVDLEAVTNFYALATVVTYLHWHRTRQQGWFALSLVLLFLGMSTDWPAYYLAGLLPLHHLLSTEAKPRAWRILAYFVMAVAMFAVHLLHIVTLGGGDALVEIWHVLVHRIGSTVAEVGGAPSRFTLQDFIRVWMVRANLLFTLPMLLLSAVALGDLARRRARDIFSDRLLPVILLAFGLANLALFPQGAYVHDFWAFYCAAPLALLAGGGLLSLAPPPLRFRLFLVILALFVSSAVPKIIELHRRDTPTFRLQGLLLASHTKPGKILLTNDPSLWMPLTRYYAQRDVWVPRCRVSTSSSPPSGGCSDRPFSCFPTRNRARRSWKHGSRSDADSVKALAS